MIQIFKIMHKLKSIELVPKFMCMKRWIYICIYIYVFMFNRETDRERERER